MKKPHLIEPPALDSVAVMKNMKKDLLMTRRTVLVFSFNSLYYISWFVVWYCRESSSWNLVLVHTFIQPLFKQRMPLKSTLLYLCSTAKMVKNLLICSWLVCCGSRSSVSAPFHASVDNIIVQVHVFHLACRILLLNCRWNSFNSEELVKMQRVLDLMTCVVEESVYQLLIHLKVNIRSALSVL